MAENKAVLKVTAEIADAIKKLDLLNEKIEKLRKTDVKIKITSQELQAVGGELAKVAEAVKVLTKQVNELNKVKVKPKVDAEGVSAGLKKIEADAEKAKKTLKKLGEKQPIGPLAEAITKEGAKVKAEMNKLVSDFEKKSQKLTDAAKRADFKPWSKAAKLMKRDVVQAAEAVIKKFNELPPSVSRTGAKFQDLAAKAKQAQVALKAFKTAANDVKSGTEKMVSSLKKLSAAILSVKGAFTGFIAILIAKKLYELGKAATDTAVRFEAMKKAFEAVSGSAEAANQKLGFLRDLSDTLGLKFEGLTQNFLRLTAAAQGTAFEGELLENIFTSVSLAAAGLQLSAEDVTGIFFALEQTISKGTVQAEELRRQLGNRLPGAFKLMAQGLKITEAELSKFLKQGVISAQEGLSALALQMLDTFGSAALANIDSTRSELNRLSNTIFDLKLAFANELLPSISNLSNRLGAMGEEGEAVMEAIGKGVSSVIDFVTFLVSNVGNLGIAFDALKGKAAAAVQGILSIFENIKASTDASFITEAIIESVNDVAGAISDGLDDTVKAGEIATVKLKGYLSEIAADRVSNEENAAKLIEKTRAELEAKIAAAQKKGTTLTKEELKKRQSAYEEFFESILKLAEQLDEALKPPETADPEMLFPGIPRTIEGIKELKGNLQELEAEWEEINASPQISQEQVDRADQLSNEIDGVRAALKGVSEEDVVWEQQQKTISDFGDKVREVVGEVVTNSREFRSAFAALPEGAKASIEQVINEFTRLTEASDFTGDDIRRFVEQISTTFKDAGIVTNSFSKEFEGMTRKVDASADGVANTLGKLSTGIDKVKTSKDAEDEALQANVKSMGDLDSAAKKTGQSMEGVAGSVADAGSQFEGASAGIQTFADESEEALAELRSLDNALGEVGANLPIEDMKRNMEEFGGEVSKVQTIVNGMGEELTNFADGEHVGVQELSDQFARLGLEAGATEAEVKKSAEAFENWVKTSSAGAELLQKANGEIKSLGDTIEIAGPKVSELGDGLQDAGENAGQAATGFDALQQRLKDQGAVAKEAADSFEVLGSEVKESADGIAPVIKNWNEAGTAAKTAEEAFLGVNDRLSELQENSGNTVPKIDEVTLAMDKAKPNVSSYADGMDVFVNVQDKAADGAEKLASALGKTADKTDETKQAADALPESAEGAAAGIKSMGEAATAAESGVTATADGISKIATSAKDLKIPEDFNTQLSALGSTAQQFQSAIETMARGLSEISRATPQLKVPEGFVDFITQLGTAASANSESFNQFASAFQVLAKASSEIVTPEGLVEFISSLFEAITEQVDGFERFAEAFQTLSDAMKDVEVNEELAGHIESIGTAALDASDGMERFADAFKDFADAIANADLGDVPDQIRAIADALKALSSDEISRGLEDLTAALEKFSKVMSKTATDAEKLKKSMSAAVGAVKQLTEAFGAFGAAMEKQGPFIEKFLEQLAELVKAVSTAKGEVKALAGVFNTMAREAVPAIQQVTGAIAALNTELKLAAQNAAKLNGELSQVSIP